MKPFRALPSIAILFLSVALPAYLSAQPLIHLKQWKISEGGNDHWYGIFASTHPWVVHRDTAHTFLIDTFPAQLAAVTSSAENQFIRDSIVAGVTTDNVANEFYLGATYDSGAFHWLSGEAFAYTNWYPGEPSGDGGAFPGRAVAMWGGSPSLLGLWNDCPRDTTSVGPIHQLWSVFEWNGGDTIVGDTNPPPTLVNLKQWKKSNGGNDHWYAINAVTSPWVNHAAMAATLVHDSQPGYLATSLSQAENDFIRDSIIFNVVTNNVANEFYLGATYDNSAFHWLTPEPFTYTHWNPGEPSGDGGTFPGRAVAIWGGNSGLRGYWNDCPRDTVGVGPIHQLWSVVEWGAPDTLVDTTTFPPLLNLRQWTFRQGGNDHWYGIVPKTMPWTGHQAAVAGKYAVPFLGNSTPAYLASITSFAENNFIRDSIVSGVQTDNISNQFYLGLTYDANHWHWGSGESFGYTNWGGGQPSFEVADPCATISGTNAPFLPGQWNDVPRDTINNGPIHQLWSVVEFDGSCCRGTVGNVDGDPDDTEDIADLTALVDWLFRPGSTTLICLSEADFDGNRVVDIGDLTSLIENLFIAFYVPPPCLY